MDYRKYFDSMPDHQIERLLLGNKLDPDQKQACRNILEEREKQKEKEQQVLRDFETEKFRSGRGKAGRMFENRTRLTTPKGRIRQGGRVNPR